MLKRLIEVALPLKEVSEQSAREKSIRHGHISTLHIWWARRPLAACRAAVFASLIPDPDDPECPEQFRKLVMETLTRSEFKPKNGDGSTVEDTPRNRCLEFIKYLVRWENSNNPEYIEPARKLIAAAHKFLHPDAEGDAPKVLDPFAGGGAIPLEALRLGCEAHAVDLNPVAHLIELCTLVYPQKYGQPDSRPVPDYIKRLIAHNRAKKKAKGETDLFDHGETASATGDEIIPDVEISEAEYRNNPLAADVKYWGHWVLERVSNQQQPFYPSGSDNRYPIAFIWARTATCTNPTCRGEMPLVGQTWLANKTKQRIAYRILPDTTRKSCRYEIVHDRDIDFDPNAGTLSRNAVECPFCQTVVPKKQLQDIGLKTGFGYSLICVVTTDTNGGKFFRLPEETDLVAFDRAKAELKHENENASGISVRPHEELPYLRSIFNCHVYGLRTWGSLFNERQALTLWRFSKAVSSAREQIDADIHDHDFAKAVATYLAFVVDRVADFCSNLTRWHPQWTFVPNTFGRQALPMTWDYAELNPLSPILSGTWESMLRQVEKGLSAAVIPSASPAIVQQGSATRLPVSDGVLAAVITDPPYYDAVPYADLSDFFYVWLKRTVGDLYPSSFRSETTPKSEEAVQLAERNKRYAKKTKEFFESQMSKAFIEASRASHAAGVVGVMYAHKTTNAWETLINSVTRSGLIVTASWPLRTEMVSRQRAQKSAALASSVFLACRKRRSNAGTGIWDDVRQELKTVAQERLDFFWNQGIRGADFFISAIGPALSVFGKYERVTKLSGEEVTVGQFLDEVRSLVSNYALTRILKTSHTGIIDPESRFYVVWKWSYADAKVPADESFKLSQALGLDTDRLWDRTGVLEKSGENVQATPVSKRMRIKNLGEPTADGAPASLIDVLHRLCAFRDKGDMQGMAQFLGRSGHANNHSLWLVAQAVSEILPDGEKEKQLMQGLLNQREGLEEATRQRELF